jgi:uncharacterized membrane protein
MDKNLQSADGREPRELAIYFEYIIALMRPGRKVRCFKTIGGDAAKTGDLSRYTEDQLKFIIDESRHRLDQQFQRFDRIRKTAQVVLPIGIALLVVVGSELSRINAACSSWLRNFLYVGWGTSVAMVLAGVLGSAAILVVQAIFGTVLPTLVSQIEPTNFIQVVANNYVSQSVVGEDTINTRITLQWWSVLFMALGGIIFGINWIVRVLAL